jgi:hypothetical protein
MNQLATRMMPLVVLYLGTATLGLPDGAHAQQGPTPGSCTAFMNAAVVATYKCLRGRDSAGRINFIQWSDGTASTGLGGWKRSGSHCFAASESPQWKICAD